MALPSEDLLDEEAALLALPSMPIQSAHGIFERLWLRYHLRVFKFLVFARNWLGTSCACEIDDLIQDTCILAWNSVRNKPLLLIPGATFGSYIIPIARHVLYRCGRRARKSGVLSQLSLDNLVETEPQLLAYFPDLDDWEDEESRVLDVLAHFAMLDEVDPDAIRRAEAVSRQADWVDEHPVLAAISRLPDRRRQCLALRCLFKLSDEKVTDDEIGTLLGIVGGTVSWNLNKAREQLRVELHELLHIDSVESH